MNISRTRKLLVLPFLLQLLLFASSKFPKVSAEEDGMKATWTPNSDDNGSAGPLPLSQQQRDQLWQLEQVITSSPDPTATLEKAAAANDMDPHDLAQLLQRNHRDLEMAGGALPASTGARRRPTNILLQAITGLAGLVWHAAVKHPRTTGWTTTLLVVLLYAVLVARPRTGLLLSSRSRSSLMMTRGPTTLFAPPLPYLQQLLPVSEEEDDIDIIGSKTNNNWWQRMDNNDSNNNPAKELLLDTWSRADQILPHPLDDDGVSVPVQRSKKSTLKLAVSCQTTLDLRDLLEEDSTNERLADAGGQWIWDHATTLLSHRELTEWASSLRLVTSSSTDTAATTGSDGDAAILVVPQLGDWGRYGLLPLRVTHETLGDSKEDEEDNKLHLVLTTLKGAHFDGQIHVMISSSRSNQPLDDDNDNNDSSNAAQEPSSHLLYVTVRVLVPQHRRCHAPSVAMASKIGQELCQSVATSLRLRTRQSLARTAQSQHYQQAAQRRAGMRRTHRSHKQQALEAMAVDRRRRWQRSNPNAGSYRPSGDRMRSPNHAVVF